MMKISPKLTKLMPYLLILFCLVLNELVFSHVLFAGTPHLVYGTVTNSNSSTPGDSAITFKAYIATRPTEVQTQASPGSGYGSGSYYVEVGNFPSTWSAGETLVIEFTNTANNEKRTINVVLSSGNAQQVNVMLQTNTSTAYNVSGIVFNPSVTSAQFVRVTEDLTVSWTAPTGTDPILNYFIKINTSNTPLTGTALDSTTYDFKTASAELFTTIPKATFDAYDSNQIRYLHIRTQYLSSTSGSIAYGDDVVTGPIRIDNVAPTGTIRIVDSNGINDVTSTNNTTVYLKLAASGSPVKVYLSETSTRPAIGAIFSNDAVYSLGNTAPGSKTIFAWFEDSVGNISAAPATDSFTLLGSISISPYTATLDLAAGGTQVFSVSGTTDSYSWAISDPTVAEFSGGVNTGNPVTVKALKIGTFTLTTTSPGSLTSGTITVVQTFNAPTVSIPMDIAAPPGGTVIIPINITGVSGAGIGAYGLRLDYDASVLSTPTVVTTGTLSDGKTVQSFAPPADGIGKFSLGIGFGFSPTSDGILVKVQFNVSPTFTGSSAISIISDNVKSALSTADFTLINATYVDGSVKYSVDTTAPAAVTGLVVTPQANSNLKLDWTNPTADFSGVIVVAATGVAPTLTPVNGTTYTVGQNGVLATGNISTFTEVLTYGIHRYYKVFAYDSAKNYSPTASVDAVSIDSIAPTGSIKINDNAAITNNQAVTLTLSASDTGVVTEMRFSKDNADWTAPVVSYALSYPYTLPIGDGTKTVYVKFKDTAGNWSSAYSDAILLDTKAPAVTANPATGNYPGPITVELTADETATIYYTTNNTEPTISSSKYTNPIAVSLNTTLSIIAIDSANNSSPVKTETYTFKDVSITAGSIKVVQGETRQTAIILASTGGFNEPLTLTYAYQGTQPSDAGINIIPQPVVTPTAAGETVTLSFTAGAATPEGNYTLRVTATGGSFLKTVDVPISVSAPLSITTSTIGNQIKGQAFSTPLNVIGGIGAYVYSISTGTLPEGLTLNADGSITGTPSGRGTHTFTITVQDADGHSANKEYTVRVYDPAYRHLLLEALSWDVQRDAITGWITVKVLDDYDVNVSASIPITIDITSSSLTGRFSTDGANWSADNTLSPDISAGSSSKRFKYRDSTAGTFSITVTGVIGTPSEGWAPVSHSINIIGVNQLSVTKTGTGSGSVTPDSGSIVWIGNTGTASYSSGTTVTLNALPNGNSSFAGWGGECSGSGACTVLMNAERNLTALFNLNSSAKPQNPKGLIVEQIPGSTTSLLLRWNKNSEQGVTYNVFRNQTQDGIIFYKVNTNPIGENNFFGGEVRYVDTNLKEGIKYYYKIQSVMNGVASDGLSEANDNTVFISDDYEVRVIDPTNITNVTGSAKYHIQVIPREKFQGTITLSCFGLSPAIGLSYEFFVNGEKKDSVLTGMKTDTSVILQVTAGSITQAQEYQFKLSAQNNFIGGSSIPREMPLSLTIVPKNEAGIHVEMDKYALRKGERVAVYGSIWPPAEGKTIRLRSLNKTDGSEQEKTLTTDSGGKFVDKDLIPSLNIGEHTISASWRDDNSDIISSERSFVVDKGEVSISCIRNPFDIPQVGSDFKIQGSLNPTLPFAQLILQIISPDGKTTRQNLSADIDGQYQMTDKFFAGNGLWKFRVYYEGSDKYIGSESNTLVVPVGIDAGRAIILGGGEADQSNTYWKATKNLVTDTYLDFKKKGFGDELIWLILNSPGGIDINRDGNDEQKNPQDQPIVDNSDPSISAFLTAVETQFSESLAGTQLFIYMQGHATPDRRFKVMGTDQFLTGTQLKGALDRLQAKVDCTVVIVMESCYSSNFIQDLSGSKRIIITSAGSEPYNTDQTGRLSFSRYFFSKLREGDPIKKAYDYSKTSLINMGYPAPQLDDNGDGTSNSNDGILAANTYLNGSLTWGLRAVIDEISVPQILEGISSTSINVSVVAGDDAIEKVWVQIIEPDVLITGAEGTISYPEVSLVKNESTGKYEGILSNLKISGLYKIVAFAQDRQKEISDPKTAFISVSGNTRPGDFNGDNRVTLADAIIAMQVLSGQYRIDKNIVAADVNNDNRIGLPEVIYVLQKAAGMR